MSEVRVRELVAVLQLAATPAGAVGVDLPAGESGEPLDGVVASAGYVSRVDRRHHLPTVGRGLTPRL
jgi:hypothetical protein